MATQTVRTGGTGLDTSDFASVVKTLRKAAPQVSRDLKRELRKAGEIVAVEAREIARQNSTKIPPTIKVRTLGATVMVIAGGDDAAIAGLFELGNTGGAKSVSASKRGTFRHPVFGNRDVWVTQSMHRFLAPAALANAQRVEDAVVAALDKATRVIVFEGRHG